VKHATTSALQDDRLDQNAALDSVQAFETSGHISKFGKSPDMSPLGLMRALEICFPSGMRMAFTTPPEFMADENTLHRIRITSGRPRLQDSMIAPAK
jgi:hypothetical protein